MIHLSVKQSWLDKSSESALEEFKASLVEFLNTNPTDTYANKRWQITQVSEGDVAYLLYDEQPLLYFKIEDHEMRLWNEKDHIPRYDDIMFAIRHTAQELGMAVVSHAHDGARLPRNPTLALDHSFFGRDNDFAKFFGSSRFIPRYCIERYERGAEGKLLLVVSPPFYAEEKETGAIHLINYQMLNFLVHKDNQEVNQEFSYKVADSMADFAKKYDFALVPESFYRYYKKPTKILNETDFDISRINRKVFVDPYVWDFDNEKDLKFYQNIKNGLHLMDKVRKGETLEESIKRVLREELKVADDFVGARVWALEFDRDREGILTPRLKIHVYVHGLIEKHKSKDHDWVSIK
jgi:hypothetical protein